MKNRPSKVLEIINIAIFALAMISLYIVHISDIIQGKNVFANILLLLSITGILINVLIKSLNKRK